MKNCPFCPEIPFYNTIDSKGMWVPEEKADLILSQWS